MKRKMIAVLCAVLCIGGAAPTSVLAAENVQFEKNDLEYVSQDDFEVLIETILEYKANNPDLTDEEIIELIDNDVNKHKSIFDIWNALTDSEKKLCIRYPFEALKVNTAKDIATTQTEKMFGVNGLGDRSDAFRHGIWNAEMAVLIGEEKAELFATAHEDKDTSGTESDGFSKEDHKNMDLHNNEVGRKIGVENPDASEDEMAEIIYQEIYAEDTQFIWLHD